MGFFRKKNNIDDDSTETIVSPLKGEIINLSEVNDEAFSSGVLGPGLAIIPQEGKLYAPCDGEITTFFPTGHAIGITTSGSVQLLIHVGIDTVKMEGEGFRPKKKQGDIVKCGELLLEFDIDNIKSSGYDTQTPIVIMNSEEYSVIDTVTPKTTIPGEYMIKVCR